MCVCGGGCSECVGCATYLLRAHSIHSRHLQRAHLHLAHHRVHVLNAGVPTGHGHGDAHVVVDSWLCGRGLALDGLAEHTVNSKTVPITSTHHECGDNVPGLHFLITRQNSKDSLSHH